MPSDREEAKPLELQSVAGELGGPDGRLPPHGLGGTACGNMHCPRAVYRARPFCYPPRFRYGSGSIP